ncbi:hypothetical protein AB3X52_07940 [Nocardioides sp. DS6]|uniref:Uncharacterized protein n=1 Tax=Nocardioides eburneus TaxID=3231482 RepID=A0ABV3T0X3_9ACTN
MNPFLLLLGLHVRFQVTLALGLSRLGARDRDDRGDVPGWVMVTVMTAGLCAALVAIAKPQLSEMLQSALDKVR